MNVDADLIKRIAKLARIELKDSEITKFEPQFKEILDAFSKLDEVDVANIKPSFQPVELKNVIREDNIGDSLLQERALKNSEHIKDGYFKGPKAI